MLSLPGKVQKLKYPRETLTVSPSKRYKTNTVAVDSFISRQPESFTEQFPFAFPK